MKIGSTPILGIVAFTFIVISAGTAGLIVHSMEKHTSDGSCPTSKPQVVSTRGSAAGQGPLTRGSAPPWPPTPSPAPAPTVSHGQALITDTNNPYDITVPKGTLVKIDLSARGWTLPQSSDERSLKRLSAKAACDGSVSATFLVLGAGTITASGGGNAKQGGPTIRFHVNLNIN